MSRIFTTAMGKSIDMAALRAKNEEVRAVGNMNVNSRGDVIDGNNNIIQDRTARASARYRRAATNVGAQQRTTAPAPVASAQAQAASEPTPELTVTESQEFQDWDEPNPVKEEKSAGSSNSGAKRGKKQ